MKLILLTTETQHHAFFARELNRHVPIECAFLERRRAVCDDEVHHPMEDLREQYERERWFSGQPHCVGDFCRTMEFESMNDPDALDAMRAHQPDVMIVFGTGRLSADVIEICPGCILNLHGGDPQRYRGLDSHYWAIYHNEFDALVVTLHHVNPKLDDGDLVKQTPIRLFRGMQLHELRSQTTERCVELVHEALAEFQNIGSFSRLPQQERGRYFSFMPTDKKETCKVRFAAYTQGQT